MIVVQLTGDLLVARVDLVVGRLEAAVGTGSRGPPGRRQCPRGGRGRDQGLDGEGPVHFGPREGGHGGGRGPLAAHDRVHSISSPATKLQAGLILRILHYILVLS